jgi:hypothetical protein
MASHGLGFFEAYSSCLDVLYMRGKHRDRHKKETQEDTQDKKKMRHKRESESKDANSEASVQILTGTLLSSSSAGARMDRSL